MFRGFENPDAWPRTGNPDRVRRELQRWHETARALKAGPARDFAEGLPRSAPGEAMLRCIFGASPFLSACAIREQEFLQALWETGPDACAAALVDELQSLPPDCGEEAAARALRNARRRLALTVGLADICDAWGLEAGTEALTSLAEAACSVGFRVLLSQLAARGKICPPIPEDPERECGLFALGLGKLGGRELNYSSDIDLVLLYDPERVPAARRYEAPQHLINLGRKFNALLADLTVDGRAYRVDLRLRPDPVSTPLALSTKAAIRYYETRGQTWERAAMIKARPVAGDTDAARPYLADLAQFVWRTRLEFATARDLHDIKRRIDEQHKGGRIGAPGQNIKLGRGGIREIEFFAQAHQLIWGGSDLRLRTIPTCDSLFALADAGRIPREAAEALVDSYRFLRRVEHRIQMVADKQTHSLPAGEAEFETLARFLGYRSSRDFATELTGRLRQVERQYESFFELPLEMTEISASSALATGSRTENRERLGRMGFRDPASASLIVERWRRGEGPDSGDERTRALLQSLTPSLVIAICGTDDPDIALRQFARLIDGIRGGYHAFTLLQANLHVMESVADIVVLAPSMGECLVDRPVLLEELLDPTGDSSLPDAESMRQELAAWLMDAGSADAQFRAIRDWLDTLKFRIGIRVVFRSLDPLDAGPILADVVDRAAVEAFRVAEGEVGARHGPVPGSSAAVVATGRYGRRELTVNSPIDLAICYDAPAGAVTSGDRPISARNFYSEISRLVRGCLCGAEGHFRSDRQGGRPGAVRLDELEAELANGPRNRADLTAPRAAAGRGATKDRFEEALRLAQLASRNSAGGLDALADNANARATETGPWEVEHRRGGLVDLETLAHYLRLRPAAREVCGEVSGSIGDALGKLAADDGRQLRAGWEVLARIHAIQDLFGRRAVGERVPERLRPLFEDAAGVDSFEKVSQRIDSVAEANAQAFERLLGRPPAAE